MIKAVLFDLDRTLLDRDASLVHFLNSQYERHREAFASIPKEDYRHRVIELDEQGYMPKDQVYTQLIKEYKVNAITPDELYDDYKFYFKMSCKPIPNLIPMLDNLKRTGIRLGMITNGIGVFQMANIQALEIKGYFETISVSEWEGISKPDPAIFLTTLERMDLNPEESIFVGDHLDKDVKAAEQAGMTGIWKRSPEEDKEEVEYIIDDLLELPHVLRQLRGN